MRSVLQLSPAACTAQGGQQRAENESSDRSQDEPAPSTPCNGETDCGEPEKAQVKVTRAVISATRCVCVYIYVWFGTPSYELWLEICARLIPAPAPQRTQEECYHVLYLQCLQRCSHLEAQLVQFRSLAGKLDRLQALQVRGGHS